jgi:hypothetical protein
MHNEVVPARAGTPWNFKEVAVGRVIEEASGFCRRSVTNAPLKIFYKNLTQKTIRAKMFKH